MNMNHWTIVKDSLTLLVTGTAVIVAAIGYLRNARTRRAEFLWDLHQSFFEKDTYKNVRRKLDETSAEAADDLDAYIESEAEEFTDFLNFFELVSYLEKKHNLSLQDVRALLGYYLSLLSNHQRVRSYIRNPANGFEELDRLLGIIERSAAHARGSL